MIQRLVAAAVGLAILLPAVLLGGTLAVEVIIPLAAAVCLYEYGAMAFPEDLPSRIVTALGFVVVYVASMYGQSLGVTDALPVAASLCVIGAMLFVTLRPGDTLDGAADRIGRIVLGIGWISGLGALLVLRREPDGLLWLFVVLAASWLGDTGGYFAGKYLGKRPLYPRVSPKKTWEGVFGGITLATVGVFCVRAAGLHTLSVIDCLVLGPVLCVAGVVGDLSESLLKRAFHVKDSGVIMPGHGGLLDRIDSVLFVGPVLYAWLVLTGG